MSQIEFGEKGGFYQTYLCRIENGHANPTLNAIGVIANALGLSVFICLTGSGQATQAQLTAKRGHRLFEGQLATTKKPGHRLVHVASKRSPLPVVAVTAFGLH